MQTNTKRVVIIGAGFGGLNAARVLAKYENIQVVLIDKRNHHLFQPLLYQVATAALSPTEIAMPIRTIFSGFKNIKTYLLEVTGIDIHSSQVKTKHINFSYDYLIVAAGARQSFFGNDSWEEHAPSLKTIEQAREIRRRIFVAFEKAENETNMKERTRLLTFVIIGAGPTGVELAGALGEISKFALNREFRHIEPANTKVILLEAGKRILPGFSSKSAYQAQKNLEMLGVTVKTNAWVTNVSNKGVDVGKEHIACGTILWAAGVKPSELAQEIKASKDKQGRVFVNNDLSIKDYKHVFVIGDMAHVKDKDGFPLPGVAPVAIQQGRAVARSIINDMKNKKRKPFRYYDKGQMATVGRAQAVAEFHKIKTSGFIAWILWVLVHIYYLVGFKNRFFVMVQWAVSFFTLKRGSRIIEESNWRTHNEKSSE